MPGAGTLSDNLRAVAVFSEIQLLSPLLLQANCGAFLYLKVSYTHSSVHRCLEKCAWMVMMLIDREVDDEAKDKKKIPSLLKLTFSVHSVKNKCERGRFFLFFLLGSKHGTNG